MTSMVVMALSTSRLKEMMRAPSEMRWRSMCIAPMIGNTIAMVSGMVSATTEPGLKPRLMMLTAMMMAIACQSEFHEFADRGLDDDRLIGDQRRVDAERQIGHALVDRMS